MDLHLNHLQLGIGRRSRLCHFDDGRTHLFSIENRLGDSLGQRLDQCKSLLRDDALYILDQRIVIESLTQQIALARFAQIETRFDIDDEGLTALPFESIYSVITENA